MLCTCWKVEPALQRLFDCFLPRECARFTCTLLAFLRKLLVINGAGEWNRTLVSSARTTVFEDPIDLRLKLGVWLMSVRFPAPQCLDGYPQFSRHLLSDFHEFQAAFLDPLADVCGGVG